MGRSAAKALSIGGLVPLFIATLFSDGAACAAIVLALVGVMMILVGQYHLRCPYCGAWPRRGSLFDEYCPKCGCDLDDE